MSKIFVSVKLRGTLPPDDEIARLVGMPATKVFRKGDVLNLKIKKTQQEDLWILDLVPQLDNYESTESEILEQFLVAAKTLLEIAPNICQMSCDKFTTELYISTLREEEQGGFTLPVQLIYAAALAKLPIRTSILVMSS
jgi:hypothetical protein